MPTQERQKVKISYETRPPRTSDAYPREVESKHTLRIRTATNIKREKQKVKTPYETRQPQTLNTCWRE